MSAATGAGAALPRTGVQTALPSTEECGPFSSFAPDSYLPLTFEAYAVPMSETETPIPETPAAPVAAATPATAPKSGRGKLVAIAGGAAAIGLVIGLGIGWLGFSNDHHDGRRGGPAMSQQGRGGGGGQNGGGQMPQGRGGNSGSRKMMPGGQGQQMPKVPQTQSPQTQPGAVAPN